MRDLSAFDLRDVFESYSSIAEDGADVWDFEDDNLIRSAFNPPKGDPLRTKLMPPNERLMRTAYRVFNREFFDGALPGDLPLKTATEARSMYRGYASYSFNLSSRTLKPAGITLNSKYTASLHEWLNTFLHECIHVLDYVKRPWAFLDRTDRRGICRYDSHGEWFMSVARRFDRFGFDVEKYCTTKNFGVNAEDGGISKAIERNRSGMVLARLVGLSDDKGGGVVKIARTFKPKFESFIEACIARGRNFCGKLTKVEYYTTENPKLMNLKQFRPRNSSSGISWYFFDGIESEYGPLEKDGEFVPKVSANDDVPPIVRLMGADRDFRETVRRSLMGAVLMFASRSNLLEDLVYMPMDGCGGWNRVFSEERMREIAEDSGLAYDDGVKDVVKDSVRIATNDYKSLTSKKVRDGLTRAGMAIRGQNPSEWHAATGYVSEWVDGVMRQYGKGADAVNEDADETDADERNLIDDRYARGGWMPFRNTRTKMTGPTSGVVDVA